MADTILIACPDCNKRLRTPSHLQGKKIRCKACGHTFTAKMVDGGDEGPEAARVQSKTKGGGSKAPNRDFVADHNPYAVVETGLAHRCPHCAGEMESEDARICLHCGYDTWARERHQTKLTYETTGMDYFMWLLPGIACAIAVLAMIGFIVFLILSLKEVVEDNKDAWWAFAPKAMQVWGTVVSLFIIFFAGKFAIKRLIFNPVPPERTKHAKASDQI